MIGSLVGAFIGRGIYGYWDYKTHPGLYEMQSAPWYTGMIPYGIVTGAFLGITIVIKWVIWRRMTQR